MYKLLKTPTMRSLSTSAITMAKKRASEWALPNLDRLPGGFRGKIYNKRDWVEHLNKTTDISNTKTEMKLKAPPKDWRKRDLPEYMKNKYSIREKKLKMGPNAQSKLKRLSRKSIEGIQTLHDRFPEELTTDKLAEFFKISPIAISKILKSRWKPNDEESLELNRRWESHTRKRATNMMIEVQFEQFIQDKENQLQMEIPDFFKLELYSMYKSNGIDELNADFDDLNDARIAKEKIKDEKLSDDINL